MPFCPLRLALPLPLGLAFACCLNWKPWFKGSVMHWCTADVKARPWPHPPSSPRRVPDGLKSPRSQPRAAQDHPRASKSRPRAASNRFINDFRIEDALPNLKTSLKLCLKILLSFQAFPPKTRPRISQDPPDLHKMAPKPPQTRLRPAHGGPQSAREPSKPVQDVLKSPLGPPRASFKGFLVEV